MQDNFWYWIIGLVIYFFLQKKKNKPQESNQEPSQESTNSPAPGPGRAVTFEDLLREIQSTRPQPAPAPEPEFDYETIDYETESKEQSKPSLEQADFRHQDSLYSKYEQAKQDAFQHVSLEETIKLGDTDVNFGRFREYERDEKSSYAQAIAREFENKENLRKAFILKEVLERKY